MNEAQRAQLISEFRTMAETPGIPVGRRMAAEILVEALEKDPGGELAQKISQIFDASTQIEEIKRSIRKTLPEELASSPAGSLVIFQKDDPATAILV